MSIHPPVAAPASADILQRIVAVKHQEVASARDAVPLATLEARIRSLPAPRDFVGALRTRVANALPAVIAEVKKASPSKGVLRDPFDPCLLYTSPSPRD